MRLKRLEILGFKSFADKTKLEFDPGITAVVGPNGCGKSNIADAFRWVMGEQSAKSLRGHKMPDVIFAGTTHRKPLNFAEVTIVLGDVQEALPITYDEVAITRRLHRSGESEYFINRHPVRLKDVQSLLLDTGLGKDAYSIFEQGEIDRVINLSPLERRYIFEEAAGILRFLQRKKEALRKLEQTDLNVSRVKDIHQEVERQIIVLEEQAAKATKYKESKRQLEILEKAFLSVKSDAVQARMKEAANKAANLDSRIVEINSSIEAFTSKSVEAKQALAAAEQAYQQHREEVFKVRSRKEIKSKEKQNHEERLKELQTKQKRCKQELEALGLKKAQHNADRQTLLKAQKEIFARHAEHSELVVAQREKVKVLEEDLYKKREHQQLQQKERLKLLQNESQYESELRQLSVRLEHSHEKQSNIMERKEFLQTSSEVLIKTIEEKKTSLEKATEAIEKQKDIFASMETNLQEIADETDKAQTDSERLSQDIAENKGRQKALQRLQEEMEGFSVASKRLLNEASDTNSPFYKKIKGLYEYFSPKKGAENALAAAMKPYAQTLTVQTHKDFEAVIAYIKDNQLSDVSLLCIDALSSLEVHKQSSPQEQFSPLAQQVVENEVANYFLQHVGILAKKISPLEIIGKQDGWELWNDSEGSFIDRRGVLFYAGQGEGNVFIREAELKIIEKRLKEYEAQKTSCENVLQLLQQRKNQLQVERLELDKTIRRSEVAAVEINFTLQKTSADLERVRAEEKLLAQDLRNIASTIETMMLQTADVQKRLAEAKALATAAHKQNDDLTGSLETLTNALKADATLLREKESLFHAAAEDKNKNAHALHVLDIKDQEGELQKQRLEDEIDLSGTLQEQILSKGAEVDQLLNDTEQALSEVLSACAEWENDVILNKKSLEQIDAKLNEHRNHLKKHEGERHQASLLLAQLESHLQAMETDLRERHSISLSEARAARDSLDISPEQIERQLKTVKHDVESSGDINMTSIEECDKHKTRYQFLNQQLDDLGFSKQELVAIITQLDGESRTIFQKTFEEIRANFKKNFAVLFNGGEADLQFTESADILEAGIEIIAKPPGKQMRSINLLSGGEKCLTAMALLFAVFEVKPAPFCILDEIDAPLDDTNVERFVNIVKLFADRCQFIIITHNKNTMAIADILFGVSMQERGVSKLLSMDFAACASA